MNRYKILFCGMIAVVCFFLSLPSYGARIKDISSISGVRENQLIGYGLVVGLAGTGDDIKNGFTRDTLANMLTRQGLTLKEITLKAVNSAAVMVTATLPPFAKQGTRLDIVVSSIGNAKSLGGGTLLMTPLRGADGEVYAVAQGELALGGYSAGGSSDSAVKNHPGVGRITNGAMVEREIRYAFENKRSLTINLFQPDFTTATRMAASVNAFMNQPIARPVDSSSVLLLIPDDFRESIFEFISQVETLDIPVDAQAVVILNEKTGTVVMGENVRVSTVAVAHGNLNIQIKETPTVSQPLPYAPPVPPAGGRMRTSRESNTANAPALPPAGSRARTSKEGNVTMAPGGQTVVTTESTTTVAEEKTKLMVVPTGTTIHDVVKALNAIGVTPRDLITIMQTIKAAGALQADLRII